MKNWDTINYTNLFSRRNVMLHRVDRTNDTLRTIQQILILRAYAFQTKGIYLGAELPTAPKHLEFHT